MEKQFVIFLFCLLLVVFGSLAGLQKTWLDGINEPVPTLRSRIMKDVYGNSEHLSPTPDVELERLRGAVKVTVDEMRAEGYTIGQQDARNRK